MWITFPEFEVLGVSLVLFPSTFLSRGNVTFDKSGLNHFSQKLFEPQFRLQQRSNRKREEIRRQHNIFFSKE